MIVMITNVDHLTHMIVHFSGRHKHNDKTQVHRTEKIQLKFPAVKQTEWKKWNGMGYSALMAKLLPGSVLGDSIVYPGCH